MELLVKLTILLALPWPTALALRRAPARSRHALWLGTLVGALLLPLAPMLPSPVVVVPLALPLPVATSTVSPTDSAPPATPNAPASLTVAPTTPVSSSPFPWTTLLTFLWAAGIVVGLLRLLADTLAARRLLRACVAVEPGIFAGESVPVPMAWWGKILLPASASNWPGELRRSAILHERAHVRRRDALAHLLGRLACCLWWFHPLAHLANARLHAEAELACDEAVLAAGVAPTDYAEHLVEVARGLVRRPERATLAMAKTSELHRRVEAILRPRSPRLRFLPHLTLFVALVASLGILLARAKPNNASNKVIQKRYEIPARSKLSLADNLAANLAGFVEKRNGIVHAWRPDGTPFSLKAFGEGAFVADSRYALIEVSHSVKNDFNVFCEYMVSHDGDAKRGISRALIPLKQGQTSANVKIGYGAWEADTAFDAKGAYVKGNPRTTLRREKLEFLDEKGSVFPQERLTVTPAPSGYNYRLQAIFADGTETTIPCTQSHQTPPPAQYVYDQESQVPSIRKAVGFRVDRRPWDEVEFYWTDAPSEGR